MTDTWPADDASVAAAAVAGPVSPAATSVATATVIARRAWSGTPSQVTPWLGATGAGPCWLLCIPYTSL